MKCCIGALLLALAWLGRAGAEPVVLVLSEPGGVYAEVALALRGELRSADLVELTAEAFSDARGEQASIVAAVGAHACRRAAEAKIRTPLLCVLLPRSAFDSATRGAAGSARALAAIVLDQPFARQLALIQLTLPQAKDVGVLLGRDSAAMESPLARAARERKLRLVPAHLARPEELYPALQGVLADADVLLALPDGSVFSSATAQNVLRSAFHARVPVFAFSPGYVKAGALAAVYTTPPQIGRQTGRTLRDFLAGRPLAPAQAPREFEVSVNPQVARALGLALEDAEGIAERLRRMEPGG